MRAYFFTNMYLSSIQQGIQPLHCVVDMMRSPWPSHVAEVLHDWADNHKTVICLNAGPAGHILELYNILKNLGQALDLPYGHFCEDEYSLGGTMTTCGIIVPQPIYDVAKEIRRQDPTYCGGFVNMFSDNEIKLANLINEYGLSH